MPINEATGAIEGPSVVGEVDLTKRIRRLPAHAQAKIKAAQARAREASVKHQADYQHRVERSERKVHVDNRIADLQRHIGNGLDFPEENKEELADLIRESAEIAEELRASSTNKPIVKLPRAERDRHIFVGTFAKPWHLFLAAQDDAARFVSARSELPKGKLPNALAAGREEQEAVVSAILANDTARLDLETCLAAVDRELDKHFALGAPNVAGATTFKQRTIGGRKKQGTIAFPQDSLFLPGLDSSATVQRGVSFAIWLFRDEVAKRLKADIRAYFKDRPGVSIAEREAKDAALRARLLELHRVESRLCAELTAQGVPFEERPLHPLAWLEVDYGQRVKRAAKPGFEELPRDASTLVGGIPLTVEQSTGWQVAVGVRDGGRSK